MTRDEIDTLWHKAMHDSIKDGEGFTRYHFAALVAAAEREACAALCDAKARDCEAAVQTAEPDDVSAIRSTAWKISVCADAIRAQTILVVPTK